MTGPKFRLALIAAALAASTTLTGCVALFLGGAVVGGTLMATDRRSSGTQIDDQSIELKAGQRVRQAVGDRGHINVTSYNRVALITGEVGNDADKAAVEQAVAQVDNVRSTVNELAIGFSSSLTNRSNDALISTKVKATLVDAGDISANAFKVVTERSIVYLMGRVTEAEGQRAVDLIRTIRGVDKVVRVFEVVTEAELATLQPMGAPTNNAKPVSNKP
ncbi:BON domain-containing protein [Rhizobacter sp. Root1221]|uniref:BON domain-containing protein n=1 Tax=Rhizobacter sp. Root1221 TaxID=1736433 RepID=UPI0006F75762|nr:BON domain-containing protein [Rhizobacter sp. Root1221]KQV99678.1 transporter [Rhizobacter sp. Root1221]